MDESIFERPLEDQLCFEVYRAANGFGKMYKPCIERFPFDIPAVFGLAGLMG